jgi:ribonuclease D
VSASPLGGPFAWIDRGEDLVRFVAEVAGAVEVALDTEGNSLHAYRERTCVVQVTANGRTALLDALALGDLSPLLTLVDRPEVEVVFHGGDYDIAVLTRDHGFRFDRVFDTMIAATLLGVERVGLADLVEAQFGVRLEKKFQTADWARRPLPPEQLEYLRRDTIFLPGLRASLAGRLAAADLVEEAEIEFRRLAARRGRVAEFDPEGWRRLDGAARLDAPRRAVLAALFLWREREAERRDRPPFKVFRPDQLVRAAERPPRSVGQVLGLRWARDARAAREILAAIEEGERAAREGRAPPPAATTPPSPEERARRTTRRRAEEAVKDWRRREAKRRGVPNLVVLPNPAVEWLLDARPTTAEELAAAPDIGPKRTARYAKEILEVLARLPR